MRSGDWLETYTGVQFYPLDPRPEEILILDIAHALARVARFTGHTAGSYPYTVAQHSVLVSEYCNGVDAVWGLLHDASEAYLCDVPRPLKQLEAFAGYRLIEARLQQVIMEKFGCTSMQPSSVNVADIRLLWTEKRDLLPYGTAKWTGVPLAEPYPFPITAWSTEMAEARFLARFRQVCDV